jgi:type I restriction enzyme M protein
MQTTSQSRGALLKSARDIMRKDKGLNGDLNHLPMLTWIMFLKSLDDLELQREQSDKASNRRFGQVIRPTDACLEVRGSPIRLPPRGSKTDPGL